MRKLLAVLVLVIACEPPTTIQLSQDVDFTWGLQRPQTEPAFLVERSGDEVTVRGYYEALCQPYQATPVARIDRGVLTLRIIGSAPDACLAVVQPVGYQAVIRDVPFSARRVRVVHEWRNTGRAAETMFDLTVD